MTPEASLGFLLCCVGVGVLLVSVATSFRLVFSTLPVSKRRTQDEPQRSRHQALPEPIERELTDRLKQFQTNQFAPVIRPADIATTPVRRAVLPARLTRPQPPPPEPKEKQG